MRRYAAVVSGRVQGVGFRFFTKETAENKGLTGWVRNRFDGRVELEAQGEREDLERFAGQIKRGPIMGYVEAVDIKEIPVVDSEESFVIKS